MDIGIITIGMLAGLILLFLTLPIFIVLGEKYLFRYWDWLERKVNDW